MWRGKRKIQTQTNSKTTRLMHLLNVCQNGTTCIKNICASIIRPIFCNSLQWKYLKFSSVEFVEAKDIRKTSHNALNKETPLATRSIQGNNKKCMHTCEPSLAENPLEVKVCWRWSFSVRVPEVSLRKESCKILHTSEVVVEEPACCARLCWPASFFRVAKSVSCFNTMQRNFCCYRTKTC